MTSKVCFIGAGSGFSRILLTDLLSVPDFSDIEVAFMDIDASRLDRVVQVCQRDMDANSLKIRIQTTTDLQTALDGAAYVINSARVGGVNAFKTDIEIPLTYHVDQCVGDTLGPGGIMYAQRGIPAMLDLCRAIRETALPHCLLLNYGNPNAMLTWAAHKYGGVRVVGLCHGVQAGHDLIARVLDVPPDELDTVCAGINHQTWYVRVRHRGRDMTGRLLEAFESDPRCRDMEKVRIDMLRRFGYFSTESNGHLSEYLPWYRKRPERTADWIGPSWIAGQTGGYLNLVEELTAFHETEYDYRMSEPPNVYGERARGHEHGSHIIEALETGRLYRGNFNVKNQGCIPNLPDDAIVEVPGYVDRNGINITRVGDLPLGCAAVCNASISVQRLAVEAAVAGDDMLLRQAMMMDPLTGAVCTTPEIAQMTDELLVAQAEWLPQYAGAVADARKRLAARDRLPTDPTFTGSRQPLRSHEQIKAAREHRMARVQAESKLYLSGQD